MKFEATQKDEAAQMNGTFDQSPGQWTEPKISWLQKQIYLSSILLFVKTVIFFTISCPVTEEQNEEARYLGKRNCYSLNKNRSWFV